MALDTIVGWIERARTAPVRPWQTYRLETIPFAVYDPENVVYVNHPNPPTERPATLMAATAIDIGGVQTATLPAFMCTGEPEAVTLAYHEGFHVYQAAHFVPTPAEMFNAIAYYPELDPAFRALCRVEAAVLNDANLVPQAKLAVMAEIVRQRRAMLTAHDSLIGYERFLERNEGTASFVEQTARLALYGVAPQPVELDYGWARYYKAGAAVCWLLEATAPDWQTRVEAGESLSEIVSCMFTDSVDLNAYGWHDALIAERAATDALRAELQTTVAPLAADGALVIYYPAQRKVFRAFSPNTMQSLSDGRILHRTMFKLLVPDLGHAGADGIPAIDDIANHRVILPACEVEYDGDTLTARGGGVDVSLKQVSRSADGTYRVAI